MTLRAGQLRHKVRIYSRTVTRDVMGGTTESLLHRAWTYAAIEPLSGAERMTAQQLESGITHRVRMRPVDGITPRDCIVHGSRTLEIVDIVDVDSRNRELELTCKEAVA